MIKKLLLPIILVVAGAAVAITLIGTRQTLQPRAIEAPPLTVRVIEAKPGPVRLEVHAQGTVAPRVESDLVPEVSGNVIWVSPDLVSGGHIDEGELLLRIDDRDYVAAVARAEASVARAEADLEVADFDVVRARDLSGRDLISQADLEQTERAVRVAAASLRDAELVLETARRDLTRTEMRAPFTGLVRSEQVDVGQFVSRGAAVARMYATDFLEVRLPVADQELAYLNIPLSRRGEFASELAPAVELTASFAGTLQRWPARLVRTEAEIDPGTRMVYAIARIDTTLLGDQIPPPVGLFVEAAIAGLELDDIVVLPREALRNGEYVLTVDSENRVNIREVEVMRIYRDRAYISGGVEPGELISVSMLQTVVEGMRVRPLANDEI